MALERDAFVDQEHRDAVLDRIEALRVFAHQRTFERLGERLAREVLQSTRGDLRVPRGELGRRRFAQTLMAFGTGQDVEQFLVDHATDVTDPYARRKHALDR